MTSNVGQVAADCSIVVTCTRLSKSSSSPPLPLPPTPTSTPPILHCFKKDTMKRRRTSADDLNVDVIKHVMIFLAKSSEGARNFARAITVCKTFRQLGDDKDILKALVFEEGSVSDRDGSFWHINGLLSKSASAGNMGASNILLMYLEQRVLSSRVKLTAIEAAKKDFTDRLEAVAVVYTRGRLRAATMAWKKVTWMIRDAQVDSQEISELLKGLRFMAMAARG
ncbi:hypothetical protein NMG60_11028446 [Bertholletia excelsa]